VTCSVCGQPVSAGDRRCSLCGEDLQRVAPTLNYRPERAPEVYAEQADDDAWAAGEEWDEPEAEPGPEWDPGEQWPEGEHWPADEALADTRPLLLPHRDDDRPVDATTRMITGKGEAGATESAHSLR
jgi:hypothetical protein